MSMKRGPQARPESGFSLLEVLMTLAIGGIVLLSISRVMVWTAQTQTHAMQVVKLGLLKQNIVQTLKSEGAWRNTINAAKNLPAMACLQPTSVVACPPNNPTPFALYDGSGTLIFDATVNTTGLTLNGTPCPAGESFDFAGGNDSCPYRFELRWQAVCDPSGDPPCLNPQVLFTGHLFYRPSRGTAQRVALNEDRFSINGVYRQSAPACTSGTQQVFLYTATPTTTLNTNFIVPVYTKNIYIELWGGGGGGASYDWMTWQYTVGDPGETTTVTAPSGVISAAGGPGGNGTSLSSQSWWYSGPWNPIWIWTGAGSCDGSPAAPPDPALLSGLTTQCTPLASTNNGGQGGVCDWLPPFQTTRDGKLYGGGGASSGAWLTDCATWAAFFNPTTNVNNGGQYQSAVFTPATLPPGTVLPITVGAGGVGAQGNHWTGCWGRLPINGGAGANGLVKITWE